MKTTLSELMQEAIDNNILTNDRLLNSNNLKTQDLHAKIWSEVKRLFTSIVNWNYYSLKTVNSKTGFEKEDHIMELTCRFMAKYETFVEAVYDNPATFSYNSYFTTTFTHYICDLLKKYQIKCKTIIVDSDGKEHYVLRPVEVKDEDGNTRILHYSFTSTATPLSDEKDAATIEDVLESNTLTPEEEYLLKEAIMETPEKFYQIFMKVAKHKNKLSLLAIINLIYKTEEERDTFNICNRLYSALTISDSALVTFYNSEVKKVIKKFLITDDDSFYATGRENFTFNSAQMSPAKVSGDMSRALNIAKNDIAELYHIDLSKKQDKIKNKKKVKK